VEEAEIEARVDELRARHEARDEFVAAVGEFARTLDEQDRELLGRVLLARQPDTGGFDVLNRRLEEGGWFQRTMRKIEKQQREE
jgi:hypothetical protein